MKVSITAASRSQRDAQATVVALAIRPRALSRELARRLTAARAVPLTCPSSNPGRLPSWLDAIRADVLLLDERWLERLASAAGQGLRKRWPRQRVLLLGDRACLALTEQVVRHRLQGFLLTKGAGDVCVKAVRAVERGEVWLPRALLIDLLCEHVDAAGEGRVPTGDLTRRETQVVGYVRRGFANKRIADTLAIREDTVKKHLRSAYTKLGVHRRSEIMTGEAARLLRN